MVDLNRLRAHPDNKTKQAMQRDCEQAADELEALRKDAERYRKWRADYTGGEATEMLIDIADAWEPAQVDAAIDAALAVGAA